MTHLVMLIPTVDHIGGAERQVQLLAKALAARGWRVTIVALSGSGAAHKEELASAGVAFLSLHMRKAWIDPRGWFRYHAWALYSQPDIVHAHLPHASWFARCMRLYTPVRVLLDTIHTSSAGPRSRWLTYRLTNWLSNRITCVSESVAASCRVAPKKGLLVIPNAVEIPCREIQPHCSQSASFRWIAVGRLAPVKDYPTLLRAFAALPDSAHLQIAGSGPEEDALRALAAQLGIEDRVQFAGFQQDISGLLANADAFVLASRWEGLPVSVLEAAAAGLPVVATAGSGTSEAMQAGQTGLIVPVGDVAALSAAMARVMAMSPGQRRIMGAAGRRFVETHFSLPIVVNRWEGLYTQLLEEHPRSSRRG